MRYAILVCGMVIVLAGSFIWQAFPQGNQCRTSPVGTKSASCASEEFVTNSTGTTVKSIGGLTGTVAIDSSLSAIGTVNGTLGINAPLAIAKGGTAGITSGAALANLKAPFSVFETITADRTVSSADSGRVFFADASSVPIRILLPAASTFGVGTVTAKKSDLTSNIVQFQCSPCEQGQTNIQLPLEGDAATMASDGTNWKLIAPGLATLRHNPFVAEHTITIPSFQIDKSYNGYVMIVSNAAVGGNVLMVLPDITQAAFQHQTYTIAINKFDAANTISIASFEVGTIHWSASPIILTHQYESIILWTDGARWLVLSWFCNAGC